MAQPPATRSFYAAIQEYVGFARPEWADMGLKP